MTSCVAGAAGTSSCVRRPRVAILVLALVAVLAAAGCASAAHQAATSGTSIAAQAPAKTLVHTFRPGATPAAKTLTGTCWTTSIAVSSSSAYRCLATNSILDPCFATSRRARVVDCYADPWSAPTRLKLAARLPSTTGQVGTTHLWALRLAGGIRCVAVTGTVQIVGNVALTYSCGAGSGAAAGLTPSDGPQRTAFYRSGPRAALTQVDVTDVWYG
jgi:hypothetical protein